MICTTVYATLLAVYGLCHIPVVLVSVYPNPLERIHPFEDALLGIECAEECVQRWDGQLYTSTELPDSPSSRDAPLPPSSLARVMLLTAPVREKRGPL